MSAAIVVGDLESSSQIFSAAALLVAMVTGDDPVLEADLADLGTSLFDDESTTITDLGSALADCNLVVVASPVLAGSFSGLLKLFLDRLPAGALTGVTAIPLMVGRQPRDEMAADTFLRPVLTELGAAVPTGSLFVLQSDIADPVAIERWVRRERHRLPTRLDLLAV